MAQMRKIPTFFWEYKGQKPPNINLNEYRLKIGGKVSKPMLIGLKELEELLPAIEAKCRFYCVNGWSLEALWRGYSLSSLLDQCEVDPNAKYLRAISLGGYEDTTTISALVQGDAMLVTHMNGEPLTPERGMPIRLMIFNMYQFKGVKALGEINAVSDYRPGTWQKVGYSNATIQPYPHLAIDLNEDLMPTEEILKRSLETEQTNQ